MNKLVFASVYFSFQAWASAPVSVNPNVAASFSVLKSLVQKILPRDLKVQSTVPIGQDPHDYNLTMNDVMGLKNIDVYFYFGAGVDDHLVSDTGPNQKCKVSEGLHLLQSPSKKIDPHAWQDPEQGILMARQILLCSKRIYPQYGDEMDQNFKKLSKELTEISDDYKKKFKGLNPNQLKIVTTHAAFQYLERPMGLQIFSLQGLHSHAEPSAKSFQGLIDLVRRHQIQYLFPEQPNLSVTFKRFQNLTKLKLCPRLYSDSLSQADGPASDYPSLVRHNLETIYQQLAKSEQPTAKEKQ